MRNAESNTLHDTLTSYVLIANGVCIISTVITNKTAGETKTGRDQTFPFFLFCNFKPSSSSSLFQTLFSSHIMITPEYNNSRNNNRLLLLMEKATLTFRISQLSNQYFIPSEDMQLLLRTSDLYSCQMRSSRQYDPIHGSNRQVQDSCQLSDTFTILSPLSSLTFLLLDRFLRAQCCP